jgi:hypothetical protein
VDHKQGPYILSNELDYGLIEDDAGDDSTPHLPIMSRENVGLVQADKVTVTTVTGSGRLLWGILSASPSYFRLPNSSSFQKAFTVSFESHLLPGDSGSIVRDAESGLIYGHIIAGSSEARMAYIIPADTVLANLDMSEKHQDDQSMPYTDESLTSSPEPLPSDDTTILCPASGKKTSDVCETITLDALASLHERAGTGGVSCRDDHQT